MAIQYECKKLYMTKCLKHLISCEFQAFLYNQVSRIQAIAKTGRHFLFGMSARFLYDPCYMNVMEMSSNYSGKYHATGSSAK